MTRMLGCHETAQSMQCGVRGTAPDLVTAARKDAMIRVTYSRHCRTRMQQRGIRPAMVEIALTHGDFRWSRCRLCFRVTDRSLRNTDHAARIDQLRGLVVVLSQGGMVITAKWDRRLRPGLLRRSRTVGAPVRCRSRFDPSRAAEAGDRFSMEEALIYDRLDPCTVD